MRRSSVTLVIALLVLATAGASAEAATTPGERCRMTKLVVVGTHARDTLRCHARGIGGGVGVSPGCLGAADDKLARAFAIADKKAFCLPTLAMARAQSAAFTAAVLASSVPPPTPTPSPTPAPSPASTGCGNGVVEAGEQCDGQAYCSPTCSFALPTVCCGPTGFCLEGPFPTLADMCFLQGVPYQLGAVCTPAEPGCEPTAGCTGNCTPEATFAPTSICCELPAGCTDDEIGDTVALWGFVFQGCMQAGGTAGLGTCLPSGDCSP